MTMSSSFSFTSSSWPIPSQQRRRRRRLRWASSSSSSAAAAIVVVAISITSSATATDLQSQEELIDHATSNSYYNNKTLATVAKWRSLFETKDFPSQDDQHSEKSYDRSKLRPLDLVIDYETSVDDIDASTRKPRGYQKGNGGFLEPYDFINYQYGSSNLEEGDNAENTHLPHMGVIPFSETQGWGFAESGTYHHKTSSRIGFTNFDLQRGVGGGDHHQTHPKFQDDQRQRSLSTDNRLGKKSLRGNFDSSQMNAINDSVVEGSSRMILSRDDRPSRPTSPHHERAHDRVYDASSSTTSQAEKFAASSETVDTTSSISSSKYFVSPTEQDVTAPIIRSIFPPPDTAISSQQTFGALISDGDTGSGIESACVQFKDHVNFRTACLALSRVGENSDIWEQTFDGFGAFHGKTWKYRILSFDKMKNRKMTRWQAFIIDALPPVDRPVKSTTTTTSTTTATITTITSSANSTSSTVGASVTKLMKETMDENWPYDGVVENAVGRILFFFDSNFYVCSGTLIKDSTSDRSIVLTAAHCAYQASSGGGRFAEHALFIPDQGDTTAGVTNEVCSDDPLGCWVPAFAVVHYEWTTKIFPESVPWDYAFYVIPNDPSVHMQGFLHKERPDLSKILEELVEPLPIDFNWTYDGPKSAYTSRPVGEFTHGLGYSINRDPSFRYCSTNMETKFGISSYENLWLNTCAMSGGSSGGPWLKDMTSDGRGTVISLNSWGYASVAGMGGPNFSTAAGSKVECLWEVAMNTPLHAGQKGVVVTSCG